MSTIEIDPRLIAPPVTGVEYEEKQDISYEYSGAGSELVDLATIVDAPVAENTSSSLQPPHSVVLVKQTARVSDSGQIVVDVLLEVEEVPGAAEYEVRMAVG